jgi:hypothetical protein
MAYGQVPLNVPKLGVDGNKKVISLLGSTGSIGTQTLDIVDEHPDKFEVVALSAGGNLELVAEQVLHPTHSHPSLTHTQRRDFRLSGGPSTGRVSASQRCVLQPCSHARPCVA